MTNYSKIVYFKNWTDRDFTYKYDSQEQTFDAGQLYSLPAEIAQHFAHHLAVRECFKNKLEFLPPDKIKEYMDMCFPSGSPESSQRQGLPIDKIENGQAQSATPAPENKTESDFQKEVSPTEPSVEDNKILKKKAGRPKKVTTDDQYVKTV